jgi:hypothetical protein
VLWGLFVVYALSGYVMALIHLVRGEKKSMGASEKTE